MNEDEDEYNYNEEGPSIFTLGVGVFAIFCVGTFILNKLQ